VSNDTASTVRAEMARRRIRQADLADYLGLPQASISRRLNGRTPFAVAELVAVAALLDVPVASLLGGAPAEVA
jgi:transcriptional regulator with XRE-family HTH domain